MSGVDVSFDGLAEVGRGVAASVAPYRMQCGAIAGIAWDIQSGVPGIGDAMLRFTATWENEMQLASTEVHSFGSAIEATADFYRSQDEAIRQGLTGH